MSEAVWAEQDTTPSAIEAALRKLLRERHDQDSDFAPARVLNLIVVADRQWQGEILNRLESIDRYHPSRMILCNISDRGEGLNATVAVGGDDAAREGSIALGHERVVVDVGPDMAEHLDSMVDPLVVSDLASVVWAPHRHHASVDSLMKLAQVVLLDSVEEASIEAGLERATTLAERAYVVDLAWLRSTPWRERIAATFDPDQWRRELGAHQRGDDSPSA